MELKETKNTLNSFAKYVIQQSRSNLTKGKKNVSKDLYNSIRYKLVFTPKGFSVDFYMRDYGTFVDKGVSGKKIYKSLLIMTTKKLLALINIVINYRL